jgi:acetyl-CoA decarbonylase/synthase complex subunit gamma
MLPQKNCGECGVPTCLAFAMKLAAGQAEIDLCPYVTDEVKEELSEAAAPPIRTVEIGSGEMALKVGGELVMYRHEKTFFNPCAFALYLSDEMSEDEVKMKVETFKKSSFERVGQVLQADLFALECRSDEVEKFLSLVEKVSSSGFPLVLMSAEFELLKKAAEKAKENRPLLYAATQDSLDDFVSLAKEMNLPLTVKGQGLEEVAELTEKAKGMGVKDLVIDPGSRSLNETFKNLVLSRRAAIEKKIRPLGYPVIVFPCFESDDLYLEFAHAASYVAKYGSIVVVSDLSPELAYPLFVLRQNIYTDPQRPMQVEEKIYPIGTANKDAPFFITTNFSLTYFIVSSEIEASKVPVWLGVVDTEGLSVLTAWSAGKFTPEKIAEFVKKQAVAEKINHKKLVIPGYVAQMLGAIEDELPDFEIIVGPREAAEIPNFLRNWS